MTRPFPDPIASVAALDEPTRRRLYDFVVRAGRPVGRDEASAAVGVARPTAAFHLDRLADEGLLDVVHQRISGRTGPGAGRPAKLYLRPSRDVEVSLPQRRYELVGEVLAAAIDAAETAGTSVRQAVADRARQVGRDLGSTTGSGDVVAVLEGLGFEPRTEDPTVTLGNCPFHKLARRHTDLVCTLNLHLVEGLLDSLGAPDLRARLDPADGRCCVVIEGVAPTAP